MRKPRCRQASQPRGGIRATIIASGPGEDVDLTASEEEELLESIRHAERGDVVTAEELLRRLAR